MDADNSFKDVIWMPCLGRNLKLGDLYDCCTDKTTIGSSIWDEKSIHEAQFQGNHDPVTECTICVHENIHHKICCLGISEELYLSCAAGHIKLRGEASFFSDNVPSKDIARVALKYHTSSKVIQLNKMKLNFCNIDTYEQESATHVVTGVRYGAISIVVCDQKIQGKHDIKTTYENLKAKINFLQRCASGNCPEVLSNMESSSEKITCKVFSTLQNIPKIKTYADTVKFCEDLSKLHMDISSHVPISVSLTPLKKINSSAFTKYARNINDINIINQVKNIHDAIGIIGLDFMDLQTNSGTTLPYIIKQIESYDKRFSNLQSQFAKTLSYTVPKYRKGELEESDLKIEIEDISEKLQNLSTLVEQKLKEVQHIHAFMKAVKDFEFISSNSDVFFDYEFVICLEFNTSHLIDFELATNRIQWYEDKKIIAGVRYTIKQFLKFAKENSSNKNIKFAISESTEDKCNKLVVIRYYTENKTETFEPPTPPSKPLGSQINESSITITWSEPEHGAQFISSYDIYFHKNNDDKWSKYSTVTCITNTVVTVEHLEANTGYIFKVSATMKIGATTESQMSEVIYTAELSETTANRKVMLPQSTKSIITYCDNQGSTLKYRTPATHSSSKAPEIHSQGNISKISEKVNIKTQKSAKTATPNNPAIKLCDTNKCEPMNASRYKLKTTKVNMHLKDIELFKFGTCNANVSEKVVLLLGATGAGKTTLINGMMNYIFGVEWEDQERLVLIENLTKKKGASQASSQTTSVSIYKINHSKYDRLSYNLTVIDTPGFDDADGLKKDQTIMTKIKSLLTSDKVINHIDGIGFVVQAPLSRLTSTQFYVINSVYSLFGNDVENNIFVLTTFSDPISPPHVQSALDEASIKYNTMFKFNNSALYANTSRENDKRLLNKLLWEMGTESFSTFFREIEAMYPVSLTLTKDVLKERKKLEVTLVGLKSQTNHKFMKMQELEDEKKSLIKHKHEAEKNENFEIQKGVISPELIPLPKDQLATYCNTCKMTCHNYCTEFKSTGLCMLMTPSYLFGEYYCDLCKCYLQEHTTSNRKYHICIKTKTVTIKHMKKRYDKANTAQINVEKMIEQITAELENVCKITRANLSEMHKCIQKINKISLQPNFFTEADYISTLIASEKAEQTNGYIDRVKFYENILKELQNNVSEEA